MLFFYEFFMFLFILYVLIHLEFFLHSTIKQHTVQETHRQNKANSRYSLQLWDFINNLNACLYVYFFVKKLKMYVFLI